MNIISTSIAVLLCLSGGLLIPAANAQSLTPAAPKPSPQAAAQSPEAVFDRWDTDHNKALSLVEFKAGLQQAQTANALRALHDNFVARDGNKNNVIDASEYANLELIKQAGTSAPPMSRFDADKSQTLDFKEYVTMVNAVLKDKR